MRSFEWVTGPKVDHWLVKTVAGLLAVVGSVLGLSASAQRVTPEVRLLAVGSSLSLAMIAASSQSSDADRLTAS